MKGMYWDKYLDHFEEIGGSTYESHQEMFLLKEGLIQNKDMEDRNVAGVKTLLAPRFPGL